MDKKILSLMILSGALVLALAGGAFAVGTDVGTIITSEGYNNFIDYEDLAGNPKDRIYGTTLEATVLAIYGLDGLNLPAQSLPADQTTDPSVFVYYPYYFQNLGNTSDAFSVSRTDIYSGSYGADWTFSYVVDDNRDGVLDPGENTVVSWPVLLAEDADYYFFLMVTPDASAGAASSCTSVVSIETASTPVGEYTGANGNLYGGPAYEMDEVTTDVQAPTMTFTRTSAVDSPVQYEQTGSPVNYLPVPGAVITITLTYSNEGSASSESNIIIEKVPSLHWVAHVNATGSNELDQVNIHPAASTATGWTASYTTLTYIGGTREEYGNTTDWVSLGEVGAGAYGYWAAFPAAGANPDPISFEATYIKWEKATVEAGENKTLTWGIIIR